MRSRAAAMLLCLLALSLAARGQQPAKRQLVVPLAEGAFVGFRNETSWIGTRTVSSESQLALGAITSQAAAGDDHVVHRLLADAAGKLIFGYDLWVAPDSAAKKFRIVVRPLDPQYGNRLWTKTPGASESFQSVSISTFPKPTEPQTLDDGDAFSLDLLVNPDSGVKIVDVVKVTFDRSSLRDVDPRMTPRDVTPDVVAMEMKDYSLLINDNLAATGKSKTGCTGSLLWLYIPNRGRFVFSLVPRAGYEFRKAGIIENNRIEFTVNGDRYEWLSSSPILRGDGTWNLWVLSDSSYTPLFGSEPAPAKKKDVFDKLEDVVGAAQAPVRTPNQRTLSNSTTTTIQRTPKTTTTVRPRVMIGGADRVENLWPRNP